MCCLQLLDCSVLCAPCVCVWLSVVGFQTSLNSSDRSHRSGLRKLCHVSHENVMCDCV